MGYLKMQESKEINIYTKSMVYLITKLELKNKNVKVLSRECRLPWCHTRNILSLLQEMHIVKLLKPKKNVEFDLTPKGLQIRNNFLKINQLIKELKDEQNGRDT